jgi:nitrate/TMAO reductase-like tetraheme cytochrome c subunit
MTPQTRRERFSLWIRPLLALGHNVVTLFGAALTTASGLTVVGFWFLHLLSGRSVSPYAGIILFLVLPAVFVAGLVLMPIGVLWTRFRARKAGQPMPILPRLSLSEPAVRRGLTWIGIATAANVVIIGAASYRGVEHMDSVEFCGQTCHTVMQPEYTAYKNSPHARVSCVECHIGSGAPWFVRSKLSGTRQVFAVLFHTYSRPIPSPVQHLRPARETCEECHWPAKFEGDRFVVRTHFQSDEQNTAQTTVLVLKIGGHAASGAIGIHGRHIDTVERIRYLALDEKRSSVGSVSYLERDGSRSEYVAQGTKPGALPAGAEWRTMDCMDCHNRPSHIFSLPEPAVDQAIADGRIDRALPFVKKKAVELLRAVYADRPSARAAIRQQFAGYYKDSYPQVYAAKRKTITTAADAIADIYSLNVFPAMNVTWGTYPNHLGHEDFPGCFRCHDGSHTASDGRTISADCDACHTLLAMEETKPEILSKLGLTQPWLER